MTKLILFHLPRYTISTFYHLLDFLSKIAAKSKVNSMDSNNLAVVFAPNIIKIETPSELSHTAAPQASAHALSDTLSKSTRLGSNSNLDDISKKSLTQTFGKKKESKDAMQSYFATVDIMKFLIENHASLWTIPAHLLLHVE